MGLQHLSYAFLAMCICRHSGAIRQHVGEMEKLRALSVSDVSVEAAEGPPIRFNASGIGNQGNPVLFSSRQEKGFIVNRYVNRYVQQAAPPFVVFFPGDLSDFDYDMRSGPYRGLGWDLETVHEKLAARFPQHDMLTFRASSMLGTGQANYKNFAPTDEQATPIRGSVNAQAVDHLQAMLEDLSAKVGKDGRDFGQARLVLVGFSRGGVPLSGLIRATARMDSAAAQRFWSRVDAVHYVDVGLPGGGAYPIAEVGQLSKYVGNNFELLIHLTQYLPEPNGREAYSLRDDALRAGLKATMYKYNGKSLDEHFAVLDTFSMH